VLKPNVLIHRQNFQHERRGGS